MRRITTILLVLTIWCSALYAQGQTPTSSSRKAVELIRIINTAELGYRRDSGRFADWNELAAYGPFLKAASDYSVSSAPRLLSGYEVQIVTSADGQKFSVSLVPDSPKNQCSTPLFYSDQRMLIFEGKVIGCNVPAEASR